MAPRRLAGETDAWGRPSPPPLPKLSRVATRPAWERWALVVLRGLVFIPGILLTLYAAYGLAFIAHPLFILPQLLLAPAALVCWVQASVGKGGDRWTAGYVGFWVLEIGLAVIASWIF